MAPTTGISDSHGEEPLERILAAVAETGLALAVHAEDAALFGDLGGATTLAQWDSVRPIGAEVAAVAELLRVAPPRLRLHVTHATSPEVVERVRAAGQFVDATPHHLLLAADTSADARRKVNPPLRPVPIPSELWTLLQRGTLSAIGSDHAPHSAEAKGKPFSEAPAGMPGVATLVPLLLAKVGRGELPLGRLLDAACDRPARWIGTPHGRLLPGHRGHILVVDFRAIRKFRPEQLPVGCGWSAFEGWDSIFPREHWRNGQRIVQDGEFVGRSDGRVLRPEYAPGAPRSDGSRAAPPG